MQRENEEMKEQENSSLWQDSPHQNSGQNRGTPKEIFFMGNGEGPKRRTREGGVNGSR
jgi:hypothetical protein